MKYFYSQKRTNILLQSLLLATGVILYVALVAAVMFYGGPIMDKGGRLLPAIAFLLLFVLSATIVGLLVLARPVYLFLQGAKKEAFQLLAMILFWLVLSLLVIFLILATFAGRF